MVLKEILDKIVSNSEFNDIKFQFSSLLVAAYLCCLHNELFKQIHDSSARDQINPAEELEQLLSNYKQIISYPVLKTTIDNVCHNQPLLMAENDDLINADETSVNQYFYTRLLNILRNGKQPSDEIEQVISGVIDANTLATITILGAHLDYYLKYSNILIVDFPEYSYISIEYLLAKLLISPQKIIIFPAIAAISSTSQVNVICSRKFFFAANAPESNFYDSGLNIEDVCSFLTRAQGSSYFYLRQRTWEHQSTLPLKKLLIDKNMLQSLIYIRTDRENPWILLEISTKNQWQQILTLNKDFYINGARKSYLNDTTIKQIIHLLKFREIPEGIKGIGMVRPEAFQQLDYQLDPDASLIFSNHQITGDQVVLSEVSEQIFRGSELYHKQINEASSDYYLLSQSAITNNDFSIANMIPISKELFEVNKSFMIQPNDILLLSRSTTNTPALVPQGILNCIINLNIICIRPNPQLINPIYLFLLLKSTYGNSLITNIEKGTVLKSISILQLKQLIINVANRAAQDEISTRYLDLHNKQQEAMHNLQSFLNSLKY